MSETPNARPTSEAADPTRIGAASDPQATPTARRARVVPAEAASSGARSQQRAVEIYEAARARGYADGREAAAAEAAEALVLRDVERGLWMRSIEPEIVELTIRAVERVLGEIDDLDLLRRVSAAAAQELRAAGRVTLVVAPEDLAGAQRDIEALRQAFSPLDVADVVADPAIERGGAVLRGRDGEVDARVETLLGGLRRALSAAFAPAANAA